MTSWNIKFSKNQNIFIILEKLDLAYRSILTDEQISSDTLDVNSNQLKDNLISLLMEYGYIYNSKIARSKRANTFVL